MAEASRQAGNQRRGDDLNPKAHGQQWLAERAEVVDVPVHRAGEVRRRRDARHTLNSALKGRCCP